MKNKLLSYVLGALVALVPFGGSALSIAYAQANCTITSFTSSALNNTVSSGDNPTLFWSTSGCTSVTLSGGSSIPNAMRLPNSYTQTGPLISTTTFTLIGAGSNSSSTPSTITLTVNGGVYTALPTNVGSSSVHLNGLAFNETDNFQGYFGIGKQSPLEKLTQFQYLSPNSSTAFGETVAVDPNTTYYYQAFVRAGQTTYKGNIVSFTTPSADTPIVYATGTTKTQDQGTTSNGGGTKNTTTKDQAATDTVSLSITNQSEKISVGDTVAYTVTYANGTNKKLSNVVVSIVFPLGFTIKQSTQGTILNPTSMTANIGTLAPNTTGSIFIEAIISKSVSTSDPLVTNGTLEYTLPNGTRDSVVGYVINHASRANILGGFTLGSGFFPSTIFGWLITIIIILTIVLLARRIANAKKAKHGEGHH